MDRKQQLRLLALSAAVATLAACGGGGGDGDATAPTPSPSPSPAPAPSPAPSPSPSPTGLSAPSGTLALSLSQAGSLVSKAREAYGKSAGGFASVTLGAFNAGIGGAGGSQACPGGGTATFTAGGAGAGTYAYSGCIIGGVNYSGSAAVTFSLSGATLTQYSIVESGVTAIVNGQTLALDGRVECNADGSSMLCVGHYGSNQWGDDFAFDAGTANGSYQCECNNDRWNNVYTNMTASSGQVATQAAVGSAVINRTSASSWTVTITVNGQSQSYNITL
jgi:hypothetical protein